VCVVLNEEQVLSVNLACSFGLTILTIFTHMKSRSVSKSVSLLNNR
jgi:hypothetical protein